MPPTTRPASTTAFVKTTRPELAATVAREGLFARLDGMSSRTVAWITGPAGCGKSTLAASYIAARNYRAAWYQVDRDDDDIETFFHFLSCAGERIGVAPERLPTLDTAARGDLGAYARAFFRRLFAEAGAGAALVIDNLDLPDERSPLRRCLEQGLTQVPRHCAVLVTSRDDPPPGLARLRANGDMVCLGADELRLSPAEVQAMAERRGRALGAAEASQLQERSQGWAAAIVLMLEHAKMSGESAGPPDAGAPEVLFDYLASEIFERFEPASREVLLRIACLPRMTAEAAISLAGDARAARLLLNLSHNDYFMREVIAGGQRVYAMHPLYREFLLRTAARTRPEAVAPDALVRGARLLMHSGLQDDAIGLLAQAGDWAAVAAAVGEQADALLAQGRRAALLGWLERMPPATLEADPKLLCADAACRLIESPRAARQRFEQAWRLARERDDAAARRLACVGIVEAIVGEFDDLAALDPWLPELITCLERAPAASHARLMEALFLRDPGAAAFTAWCVEPHAADTDVASLVLRRLAAMLRGDMSSADALGRATAVATPRGPQAESAALSAAAWHWLDGDVDAASRTLQALDADAPGARAASPWRTMLQAAVALARDDTAAAAQALEALEGCLLRRGERALLHTLHSAVAAARHEPALALREARGALHVAIEVGAPWIEVLARLALAQAELRCGDRAAAQAQLAGADALVSRIGSAPLQASVQLVRAAIAFAADDESGARSHLHQALAGLRSLGARQVLGVAPATLAELLAQALRLGVEVDVAQGLVRRLGLHPPAQARRLRRWAWRYELGTLGGFELLRDGQPIEFSAKGPGRPLELLKVLVAYGGRHVRVDELTDALWPHVDGDYAYKSFTATLHRLRRLLGDDDALLLREGRLSLNPARFWVDAWAFDHLVAEVDACADAAAPAAQLRALTGELVALYRGPFLPDESDQSAYLARREQLRARLLRALGQAWPSDGDEHSAAEVDAWARCIQADELHEPFHRELMMALQRRGEVSRAAAAYQHLRALLAARLHLEPAPETQAVYQDMLAR
jgi:ATP/maltotriose-dependent transcriptional regulator MalT/DNA-binding SARP family transcriptional activator